MNCNKLREGKQWYDRHRIAQLCLNTSQCFQPQYGNHSFSQNEKMSVESMTDATLTRQDFLHYTSLVPFILCVHGGGLDPSPKAWESMIVGTIPIILHSTLDDAYVRFPLIILQSWDELFFHSNITELLETWLRKLGPYYEEGSRLRNQTLEV
jgi:hypothetical protein